MEVTLLPAITGLGVLEPDTPKSAAGPTVVETDAKLLNVIGSTSEELMEARWWP